jgi:hypothetical protein
MVVDIVGNLIAVATTFNEDGSPKSELLEVSSDDDWASAEVDHRAQLDADLSPTTVALREGAPFVVHAHFNEYFGGQSVDEFEIRRMYFED